ncbi:MAG: hypothetical protein QME52_11210 [Bacteroidota bacterium]|nr:hypothetical protein [Bacteroidota bacterium]
MSKHTEPDKLQHLRELKLNPNSAVVNVTFKAAQHTGKKAKCQLG